MDTGQVLTFIIGFLGFFITLAFTAGLIFYLRKPLAKVVEHFIHDAQVAKYGVLFILALIGLAGLTAAFGAFFPQRHGYTLFFDDAFQFGEFMGFAIDGLLNIIARFVDVLKWAALLVAIFFIGETLKNQKNS